MTPSEANAALDDIAKESDPVAKHLKLASVCSTLFAAKGIDLIVVGGSAIPQDEVKKLIDEQAKTLKVRSPYHSDQ